MTYYNFYSKSQWWDKEYLQQYQDARVRETISIAYNEVPFYKELFDKHGVNINNSLNVKDLPRFPVVTKDLLRRAYPDKCTRETSWPWHEYCTSGSSGKPFAVRVDNLTMSMARALMFLRANFSGWNIGDPFIVYWDDIAQRTCQED